MQRHAAAGSAVSRVHAARVCLLPMRCEPVRRPLAPSTRRIHGENARQPSSCCCRGKCHRGCCVAAVREGDAAAAAAIEKSVTFVAVVALPPVTVAASPSPVAATRRCFSRQQHDGGHGCIVLKRMEPNRHIREANQ
ncbi:hypothetical protein ABZP36_034943 [Zizania latifolia]